MFKKYLVLTVDIGLLTRTLQDSWYNSTARLYLYFILLLFSCYNSFKNLFNWLKKNFLMPLIHRFKLEIMSYLFVSRKTNCYLYFKFYCFYLNPLANSFRRVSNKICFTETAILLIVGIFWENDYYWPTNNIWSFHS